MKTLIVLEFNCPSPESVAQIISAINPPGVPYFTGLARVVVDPHATELTDWLDA